MATVLDDVETLQLVVKMPPSVLEMNDDQFFDFCQVNELMRIERTAEGDILIMAPAGSESSQRELGFGVQLFNWAKVDGRGVAFGATAGFTLPNGAVRSPDAAWILKSKLKPFSRAERRKFLHLCPDFVIEIKSPTDRLSQLKNKMVEYIENGAQLGWLLDPDTRRVFVYRPGLAVEVLNHPEAVSGDPELPRFVLDLKEIWEPE